MPPFDASAKAALAGSYAPAYFLFLDILNDPLRITTFGSDTAFTGTGDTDLDGFTFTAFGGSLLDVSDIANSDTGSDTLTVTLSGIVNIDTSLVNDFGNKSLWQGRTARIWTRIYDETGTTAQGAITSLYTGYMASLRFSAEPSQQKIELSIENYLAYTTHPSERSYLNQKDYDPADTSAAATIAAANGLRQGGNGAQQSLPPSGSFAGRDGASKVNFA